MTSSAWPVPIVLIGTEQLLNELELEKELIKELKSHQWKLDMVAGNLPHPR